MSDSPRIGVHTHGHKRQMQKSYLFYMCVLCRNKLIYIFLLKVRKILSRKSFFVLYRYSRTNCSYNVRRANGCPKEKKNIQFQSISLLRFLLFVHYIFQRSIEILALQKKKKLCWFPCKIMGTKVTQHTRIVFVFLVL